MNDRQFSCPAPVGSLLAHPSAGHRSVPSKACGLLQLSLSLYIDPVGFTGRQEASATIPTQSLGPEVQMKTTDQGSEFKKVLASPTPAKLHVLPSETQRLRNRDGVSDSLTLWRSNIDVEARCSCCLSWPPPVTSMCLI